MWSCRTHTQTNERIHTNESTHVQMNAHTFKQTHTHSNKRTHKWTHKHANERTHIQTNACTHLRASVHTLTLTHTQTYTADLIHTNARIPTHLCRNMPGMKSKLGLVMPLRNICLRTDVENMPVADVKCFSFCHLAVYCSWVSMPGSILIPPCVGKDVCIKKINGRSHQ